MNWHHLIDALCTIPSPFLILLQHAPSMKYYKPMLYSAVAIVYASLGFRVFRLSYVSHQMGKERVPRQAS